MKTLKFLIVAAALAALGAFAFAPAADARTPALERHGGHHQSWKRHHHGIPLRNPRVSVGFTIPILPRGHLSLAVGGRPYYFHGGHFYRRANSGYIAVTAPLGAAITSLPAGAVRITLGGAVYYQYADTYYQWHPARKAYQVVAAPSGLAASAPSATAPITAASTYTPGQVLDTLPQGYTAEVINGIQYYRYGSDYFMPTQRDGREVYVVVQI
ncbi:hypothetical protein Maes01_00915 [Microbulbifer aestuariivivens]|uniref:Uncharacterized protein n=1 Tax=Microbulbifer aestuariivivens TaxID=1908308 RepID=A0ABP9WMC4_9GAMM